ncbi:MAG: hypothetical protein FJ279_35750, partial [Planctomycetes bacterium]|nr:hypothetical protein [Planctomycetota bacterium]
MFKPVAKPRIAALGLSLPLYAEALPGLIKTMQRQLQAFVAEVAPHADVASSKLCYQHEQVAEGVAQAEADGVDALLVVPLSYTASLMSLQPLVRTKLPLVIWNTQEALEFGEDYDFDALAKNHVTQGTQDVTNALCRSGRVFGMESGHYQDAAALAKLGDWLAAARAFRAAHALRVGILGAPFQDMGDFGVDTTLMASRWGPYVVQLSVARFVELMKQVPDEELLKMAACDREQFEVAADLDEDTHRKSLAAEWALRQIVAQDRLDAFTMNFLDLMADGRCEVMPLYAVNKLMADGMGYAGEGNVTIAAHSAQMRQLCGQANFTEIYTLDYQRNRMMMTHMQECNPALARRDRKVRLIKKPFWAPGIAPYVGMHFTLEPGPVTLTNLTTDAQGRFHYIAYESRIVDMPPLPRLDVPHWVVALDEPVGDFLTRYSCAGGTHHLVSVPGHRADALRKLAQ